jgi:hypothetical protein
MFIRILTRGLRILPDFDLGHPLTPHFNVVAVPHVRIILAKFKWTEALAFLLKENPGLRFVIRQLISTSVFPPQCFVFELLLLACTASSDIFVLVC